MDADGDGIIKVLQLWETILIKSEDTVENGSHGNQEVGKTEWRNADSTETPGNTQSRSPEVIG